MFVAQTATDTEISALVARLAELNGGGFIRPNTVYSMAMREAAFALMLALGAHGDQAQALRDHELTAYYSVARKNPEAAKRMVLKQLHKGSPLVEPMPAPQIVQAPQHELTETLARLTVEVLDMARNDVSQALASLPALVAAELARIAPRPIEIRVNDAPKVQIEQAHEKLGDIVTMAACRVWPMLVGPAGSGKTTIAENVAKALALPFYFAAKVTSEFALLGFMNAQGAYVMTEFRRAYEFGGVFLLDEVDGSNANALTAFNAALANGHCPFPDGMVARHPDFVAIAAGNTFGRGADRQYVGRTQLDAATLDRFAIVEVDYDNALELRIAGNADWTKYVQAIRQAVLDRNVRHIVSPRASIAGSKLIAAGMSWDAVADAVIWKGLDKETRLQIESVAPLARYETSIL